MKKLALFSVLLIVTACSSVKTSYDYDKEIDFSKYKTYAFSEETKNLSIDDINRNRILKASENELTAKGFSTSANPDIIVDIHIKGKQYETATANSTSMMGYGGYRGYRGYGYGRVLPLLK